MSLAERAKAGIRSYQRIGPWVAALMFALALAAIVINALFSNGQTAAARLDVAQPLGTEPLIGEGGEVVVVEPVRLGLWSQDPVVVAAAVVDLQDEILYAENAEATEVLNIMFGEDMTSRAASQFLTELTDMRVALSTAPSAHPTVYTSSPLTARRVESDLGNDDGRYLEVAYVEVWAVEVFSRRGIAEPQADYNREMFKLVRSEMVGDRWFVVEWRHEPGPVPALAGGLVPSTALEVELDLEGHKLVRGTTS